MKIIRNKSFVEFLNKYGHSYRSGKVIKITNKQEQEFKDKYGHYFHSNKKYPLDRVSLLNKNRKYYYIDNTYYQCPKVTKNGFITLVCSAALIITGGSIGGYYLYKSFNTTSTNIKSQEVKEYTEIISENPPLIGESYKCEIKINKKGITEGDNQRFMPASLKTVTTGGVVIPEWHSENKVTVSPISNSTSYKDINNISNDQQGIPDNYYTYTLNNDRTQGNLFIKKVLGPVEIDFDLSNIKSIEITKKPHKLTYFVGQKFEANGLTILATDVHGNTKQILDNDSNISLSITNGYEFKTSDVGTRKKVTATYKEAATSFEIDVINDSIEEIDVDYSKCKTNFLVDEAINLDGLVVKAKYRSAPSEWKEISGYSVYPSIGCSFSEVGSNVIEIQCPGVSKVDIPVTIKEHKEMRIASLPSKVSYKVGDEFTLAGLKMAVTDRLNGQRGVMDIRERKYKITDDSDIQEGYVFKTEDIGHLKKIKIQHTQESGTSYIDTFFVCVPLDCTLEGDNSFISQYSKVGTSINAFKLTEPGLYEFSGNYYGGASQDVMIIGTDGAEFDAVSKTGGSEGYPVSYFSGLNVMLCDLTFARNNGSFYMPGFIDYESAIFSNVTFNENYWYWGKPTYEPQEHTSNLFFDCKFNTRINDTYNDYACDLYTGNLEFNNCVFNSNTRHVKTNAGRSYGRFFLTFNDCKFKSHHSPFEDPDHPGSYDDHLISMDDVNCATVTLSLNNCTKVDAEGEEIYHTSEFKWYKVKSTSSTPEAERSLVFINGVKDY